MRIQVIVALLCIALTFTAAAVNYRAVDRFVLDCSACIDEMCRGWSETDPVSSEKLTALWQSHLPWLEAVVHHNLLRDAEDALSEFSIAAEGSDRDEFFAAAAGLASALCHIERSERLSLGNIL